MTCLTEKTRKSTLIEWKENSTMAGSALQLLLFLLSELTEHNSQTIKIPVEKYFSLRSLSDKAFAKKQLKQDLNHLISLQFCYRFDKKHNWREGRIFEPSYQISSGLLVVTIDDSFLPFVPPNQFMWLPFEVLVTSKNENLIARLLLTWRICQHKRMNLDKSNADLVPIHSLLESCDVLPRPENIGKAGQIQKRIIDPFENALNRCSAFSWEYENEEPQSYTEWHESRIRIHWKNDPYADSSSLKTGKARHRVVGRKIGSGG